MASSAYVTIEELPLFGITESEIGRFTDLQLAAAIEIASSEADAYISAFYDGTLTAYPPVLKKHVTSAVRKHLLDLLGRSPQGDDALVDLNYSAAISFYKDLQRSKQHLPDDKTAPAAGAAVIVSTVTDRGW